MYDRRTGLGWTIEQLAARANLSEDDVVCIEEGGTATTVPLLRRLAAAFDAEVHLTAGHGLGSVWFDSSAA